MARLLSHSTISLIILSNDIKENLYVSTCLDFGYCFRFLECLKVYCFFLFRSMKFHHTIKLKKNMCKIRMFLFNILETFIMLHMCRYQLTKIFLRFIGCILKLFRPFKLFGNILMNCKAFFLVCFKHKRNASYSSGGS